MNLLNIKLKRLSDEDISSKNKKNPKVPRLERTTDGEIKVWNGNHTPKGVHSSKYPENKKKIQ